MNHDEFEIERQTDGSWVATCKGCGWASLPVAHPLNVGNQTLPHTNENRPGRQE